MSFWEYESSALHFGYNLSDYLCLRLGVTQETRNESQQWNLNAFTILHFDWLFPFSFFSFTSSFFYFPFFFLFLFFQFNRFEMRNSNDKHLQMVPCRLNGTFFQFTTRNNRTNFYCFQFEFFSSLRRRYIRISFFLFSVWLWNGIYMPLIFIWWRSQFFSFFPFFFLVSISYIFFSFFCCSIITVCSVFAFSFRFIFLFCCSLFFFPLIACSDKLSRWNFFCSFSNCNLLC